MENEGILSRETPIDAFESGKDGLSTKELYRATTRGQSIRLLISTLILSILTVVAWFLSDNRFSFGGLFGISLCSLLYWLSMQISLRRAILKAKDGDVITLFEAFSDRLRVTVSKNGAEQARWSICPDTEKRVLRSKNGTVMVARGWMFGLTNEEAAAHPAVAAFFTVPQAQKEAQVNAKFSLVRWVVVLFVFAGLLFCEYGVERIANPGLRLAIFALLLLIMLGLAVFCFLLKGKLKLFWLYGAFCVIVSLFLIVTTILQEMRLSQVRSDAPVDQISEYDYDAPDSTDFADVTAYTDPLGIALPECDNVMLWFYEAPSAREEGYFSEGSLLYTGSAQKALARSIRADDRWRTELPSALLGALPPYGIGDAVLLYNYTTGEYNTVPQETGIYRFLFLNYWADDGELIIMEYQLYWVAE